MVTGSREARPENRNESMSKKNVLGAWKTIFLDALPPLHALFPPLYALFPPPFFSVPFFLAFRFWLNVFCNFLYFIYFSKMCRSLHLFFWLSIILFFSRKKNNFSPQKLPFVRMFLCLQIWGKDLEFWFFFNSLCQFLWKTPTPLLLPPGPSWHGASRRMCRCRCGASCPTSSSHLWGRWFAHRRKWTSPTSSGSSPGRRSSHTGVPCPRFHPSCTCGAGRWSGGQGAKGRGNWGTPLRWRSPKGGRSTLGIKSALPGPRRSKLKEKPVPCFEMWNGNRMVH